jgi:hypothetical protein
VKILEDICVYKFVYESNTVSFNKLALACKQPFTIGVFSHVIHVSLS